MLNSPLSRAALPPVRLLTSPIMWTLSLALARWVYAALAQHDAGLGFAALGGSAGCTALYLLLRREPFCPREQLRALPALLLPAAGVLLYGLLR
ncbi:hypothetical protein LLR08_23320 [Rouxiella badensis]|uniref:hypothetical protein n=1 Tax=Rouxiella badensis TaxID=1646377 RepID=UPI001D15268C|nr:hypothetical protein [Rouxiella badensis]MCC3705474.1 hypothetical protein [Rouxiella badensis]